MSYINKLILYNNYTNEDIILKFKEGTNIIVGPKGGGKSTLLVLLFMAHKGSKNLKNSKLSRATWDILKHFNLEFKSLHYSDNTVIDNNSLSTALSENLEFVTQSDDIKTKINETEEIEKDKQIFIENLVNNQAKPIITVLEEYFNSFKEIYDIRTRRIDWKILQDFEKKPINYYVELKNTIIEKTVFHTKINIENVIMSISLLELYIELNKNDNKLNEYIKYLYKLLEIHHYDLNEYVKVKALNRAKDAILNVIDREIQKDKRSETKISKFESDAKLFINDMAKSIAKNAASFYNLVSTSTEIYLKDVQNSHYGLKIMIDDYIEIEQNEEHIFNILSQVLYKTSKNPSDWTMWINTSIDKDKAIKSENISTQESVYNMLKQKAEEKIILLADEKDDYNKMSLGQKTSFGLRYKISSNNTNYLFLDQPEDNIDSYTIFDNLIPLILDKQVNLNQQSFIVTHNPNFGVLTNPKSITSCDLTHKTEPYTQLFDPTIEVTTREIKKADSPLAHYLEGGKKALKNRYNILIKEKKNE